MSGKKEASNPNSSAADGVPCDAATTPCVDKTPDAPKPCPAETIRKNIATCDGGIGIWDKAKAGVGKEPAVRVAGAAGGFGGHADTAKGEIVIAPNPDCCGATQTAIHELTNLSNAPTFTQIHKDATAGNLDREGYTRANEKTEWEGVSNAVKAFDACKDKWGCGAGAKARHDWIRSAKDFDDYYDNYLAKSHKDYFRNAWDRNFKAAYDKKHP